MAAGPILHSLFYVVECGIGQWRACCPCCAQRRRDLLIREDSSGGVLIACRQGCAPVHILRAVGLTLAALDPDDPSIPRRAPAPGWWRYPRPLIDGVVAKGEV
ncbi:hypothetical protein LMG31506_02441 [Cupriavidus yeoncheonensis]|uniref:Uncharacterized protein n=1 Tax=Cupriavidus yeoncheonensis TaxID=1462994 RepID=A0A916IUW1_9BURK|nr:hypothetical protein [Cupriavidus yeoncheonensis]CAG2140976.1 hypothetical protein LMG31506_02441 [Cupriavidus yeoncheonensis]